MKNVGGKVNLSKESTRPKKDEILGDLVQVLIGTWYKSSLDLSLFVSYVLVSIMI